jgi:hypothetical protein
MTTALQNKNKKAKEKEHAIEWSLSLFKVFGNNQNQLWFWLFFQRTRTDSSLILEVCTFWFFYIFKQPHNTIVGCFHLWTVCFHFWRAWWNICYFNYLLVWSLHLSQEGWSHYVMSCLLACFLFIKVQLLIFWRWPSKRQGVGPYGWKELNLNVTQWKEASKVPCSQSQ